MLCDLWAFGMSLYELYTSKTYYNKTDIFGKIFMNIEKEFNNNNSIDISYLTNNKKHINLDNTIIEVIRLCLIHRPYNDNTVKDTVTLYETLENLLFN